MAPYDPPSTHYAHLKVDMYDEETMWAFVGVHGWRLYKLTDQLGLSYLWYDKNLQIIEIWGSYSALQKNPAAIIRRRIENVFKSRQGKKGEHQQQQIDEDASTNDSPTSWPHLPQTDPISTTRTYSQVVGH